MKDCFWPNMAVVAVENPTYMKILIYTSPVDSEGDREAAKTIRQQLVISECTRQSLLRRHRHRHRLCIEVDARMFEHLVSIGNKLQLLSEYFSGFV